MSTLTHRTLSLAVAALFAAATAAVQAAPMGSAHFSGGGHFHGGHFHHHHGARFGIGIGLGFGFWPYAYPYPYPYPYYGPGYVVVEQPPGGYNAVPAGPAAPVFTPRSGQSAQQTEADRRLCDREAMAQPAAMADATVFHRIVQVCMENRGYSVH